MSSDRIHMTSLACEANVFVGDFKMFHETVIFHDSDKILANIAIHREQLAKVDIIVLMCRGNEIWFCRPEDVDRLREGTKHWTYELVLAQNGESFTVDSEEPTLKITGTVKNVMIGKLLQMQLVMTVDNTIVEK